MSGKIIEFRIHHDLKRARLHCKQPMSRSPAGHVQLEQQIAHISDRLEELEEAYASIGRTGRRPLEARARFAVSAGPEENDQGEPQPDIDFAMLDRMYRDLKPHT